MPFFRQISRVVSVLFLGVIILTPVLSYANNTQILNQLREVQVLIAGYTGLVGQTLTEEQKRSVVTDLALAATKLQKISSQLSEDDDTRKNIQAIYIEGNAETLTSRARMVYGQETIGGVVLPPATTTISIPRATSDYVDISEINSRTADLAAHAKNVVVARTGISSDVYDAKAKISIKQFRNNSQVRELLDKVGAENFPILMGTYSIITDVLVSAGNGEFRMHIKSDQNEEARLSITVHQSICGRGGEDICIVPGRYDYTAQYSINTIVVAEQSEENFSRSDIVDETSELFSGVGTAFTPLVSDRIVIDELVDFAIGSEIYYLSGGRSFYPENELRARAESCYTSSVKHVLYTITGYYLNNLQLVRPIQDIMSVQAPVIAGDNESISSCIGIDSEFFPSLRSGR